MRQRPKGNPECCRQLPGRAFALIPYPVFLCRTPESVLESKVTYAGFDGGQLILCGDPFVTRPFTRVIRNSA